MWKFFLQFLYFSFRLSFFQDEIIRGDKRIPLYRWSFLQSSRPEFFSQEGRCKMVLTLSIWLCRRVVDAEAPLAIVIPARGSFVRMNLRENDLSWNDFLGKAGNMRYTQCIQYSTASSYKLKTTSTKKFSKTKKKTQQRLLDRGEI